MTMPTQTPSSTTSQPARRSSRGRVVGIVVVLLVVLAAAVFTIVRGSLLSAAPAPRPTDPFAGTPAASFASGADAIVLPAAADVPGFTTDEVTADLQTVKSALVAGRLDQTMLVKHDRTTFDALFSTYGKGLLDQFAQAKTLTIVATQIADGHTLTADPIRFSGQVTFSGKTLENGIRTLVVHTAYVWVYPFSGDLERTGDHLVTVRDSVDWIFPEKAEVDPDYVGMYVGDTSQYVASGVDCTLIAQGWVALGQPVQVAPNVTGADEVFNPAGSWDVPDALACSS
jgi:hypothetical protein